MDKMKLTLLALFIGLVTFAKGQDLNAAGAKFNEGIELDKAKNYSGAIKAWEESISICKAIGADADELKATVQQKLGYEFFKEGITLYKSQNFDPAIAALKNAERVANEANDAKTAKQASTYIPKIYSTKGLTLLGEKNYEGALKVFDEALEYNPNCVDAFYGKGMTYKEMDKIDEATEAFDKVIALGKDNSSAEKKVSSAKEAAQVMLEAKAATELQIEHNSEAVALLNKSLTYSQGSANAYYLLAVANNKLKNWDGTVDAAQKGLSAEGANVSALNFQLGIAYEGKGESANACAAYKKVTSGPNVEAAKFQITEVLKCN